MGSVEMIINEEEFLDVSIQHYDLRRIVRVWAKAFWRHHVVKCSTCIALINWDKTLKYVFIAVVGFSLIQTFVEFAILQRGIGLLGFLFIVLRMIMAIVAVNWDKTLKYVFIAVVGYSLILTFIQFALLQRGIGVLGFQFIVLRMIMAIVVDPGWIIMGED